MNLIFVSVIIIFIIVGCWATYAYFRQDQPLLSYISIIITAFGVVVTVLIANGQMIVNNNSLPESQKPSENNTSTQSDTQSDNNGNNAFNENQEDEIGSSHVDLDIPYRQLTLSNGQEGKIVIIANGYGEDYEILVEYPTQVFQVEKDSVTHTSAGQDIITYTVTPTLRNARLHRHVEFIIKAVDPNNYEKEYNWKVITVDVLAKEEEATDNTPFAMPSVLGYYFDDAFIILNEKGLKPVIEFDKNTKGTLRVTSQKPLSNYLVKEGDIVTITVAGWTSDNINIKPDIEHLDLKAGETKAVHLNIDGNYPEGADLNARFETDFIDFEWGDWIDNESEVFITAKKPGDTLLVVIYMETNNDGIPLAGTYIKVNIQD